MKNIELDKWPKGISKSDFPIYQLRTMARLGIWEKEDWGIKAYGIQFRETKADEPLIARELVESAKNHVFSLLPFTREEGEFYKTGFVVLHEGEQANWLLFQWWTHNDVWCQLLSYSTESDPLNFKLSTRPVRACVYETAIIWYEQTSWIKNVLNGNADRRAYLEDMSPEEKC
jgi:hypothetical protein